MLLPDRRSFLGGMAALPFFGGAAALASTPEPAATPASDAVLRRYVAFIAREHALALRELEERRAPHRFEPGQPVWHPPMFWVPEIDIDTQAMMEGEAPSTRAAVILSAAGVPLV